VRAARARRVDRDLQRALALRIRLRVPCRPRLRARNDPLRGGVRRDGALAQARDLHRVLAHGAVHREGGQLVRQARDRAGLHRHEARRARAEPRLAVVVADRTDQIVRVEPHAGEVDREAVGLEHPQRIPRIAIDPCRHAVHRHEQHLRGDGPRARAERLAAAQLHAAVARAPAAASRCASSRRRALAQRAISASALPCPSIKRPSTRSR
jgi:hypothetical protein